MNYDSFEGIGELYDYITAFSEVIRVGVYDTRLARSFSEALAGAGINLSERNLRTIYSRCRKKYIKIMRGEDVNLDTESDSGFLEFFLLSYLTLIDTFFVENQLNLTK
ncbi:MAG: hypothetical protein JRN26_06170 [Nitrososphaerota archaeon]|jgi:hypothetical protein|nr:hypothetical protein [Nitrososphaerota archaeon]MDG6931449.1 hypothetical protein [Nitrososphaerota archaeon]MDG6936449.1 hypothetical protein [Nitrososphaerota archaeon]MDG6943801.1 hypothetical protein [Nitrososphaerota archaeon]